MDKMIGKTLASRYEIVEKIGSGGMSNVYKAKCNVLNRHVAIKIMKEEFQRSRIFSNALKPNPRRSPYYPTPHRVGIRRGVCVRLAVYRHGAHRGITLKEYINQRGALKWKEAVHFPSRSSGAGTRPQPKHHSPGYQTPEYHAPGRRHH